VTLGGRVNEGASRRPAADLRDAVVAGAEGTEGAGETQAQFAGGGGVEVERVAFVAEAGGVGEADPRDGGGEGAQRGADEVGAGVFVGRDGLAELADDDGKIGAVEAGAEIGDHAGRWFAIGRGDDRGAGENVEGWSRRDRCHRG
jgi:hypothetical protein